MQVMVLADDVSKKELLTQGVNHSHEIIWLTKIDDIQNFEKAGACIDLLFEPDQNRTELLKKILPRPVLVNSVTTTLKELPGDFIRFNGWPTFLCRKIIEASCNNSLLKKGTEEIFSIFNKKMEWVSDKPGFITVRIVAMIINEAYFALGEEISSKTEIDLAMKLGTNYPFGPFEWTEKIGAEKVFQLLNTLSKENKRFEPSERLRKELK